MRIPATVFVGLLVHALVAPCLAIPGVHSHVEISIAKRDNPLKSLLLFLSSYLGIGGISASKSDNTGAGSNSEMPNPQNDGQPRKNAALERTLIHYAGYAQASYELAGKTWDCRICKRPEFQGTIVESSWDIFNNGSNGYIARNSNEKLIIVSFRGSLNLKDWIDSFDPVLVLWPSAVSGSRVAAGSLDGYQEIQQRITEQVVDLADRYPDHLILATGHSLGAARATLLTVDLSIRFPHLANRLRLYTFGLYKIGNSAFANAVDGLGIPVYRAVNRADIAPHLPNFREEYVHFGTEAWMRDDGVTVCSGATSGQCSDTLPPLVLNIIDHVSYPGMIVA